MTFTEALAELRSGGNPLASWRIDHIVRVRGQKQLAEILDRYADEMGHARRVWREPPK